MAATTRIVSVLTVLRAVVALAAGLFALIVPAQALVILVWGGGVLLIVDGLLSLASVNYSGVRNWSFWLGLLRGLLAILAGVAIVASPYLVGFLTVSLIVTFVGIQAIVVGSMEAVAALMGRGHYGAKWTAFVAGGLYMAFGLLLVFVPFAGAVLLMQIGGVMLIAYAAILLVRTWEAMRLVAS